VVDGEEVRRAGGKIWGKSQVGAGSTFTITSRCGVANELILIVEDNRGRYRIAQPALHQFAD